MNNITIESGAGFMFLLGGGLMLVLGIQAFRTKKATLKGGFILRGFWAQIVGAVLASAGVLLILIPVFSLIFAR